MPMHPNTTLIHGVLEIPGFTIKGTPSLRNNAILSADREYNLVTNESDPAREGPVTDATRN